MTADFDWDYAALEFLMRDEPIRQYIAEKLRRISDEIQNNAARTGDKIPRRIRSTAKAKNPGRGYQHFVEDIDTYVAVKNRMAIGYLVVNRHALVLEFGYRDAAGVHHAPRMYVRKALRIVAEAE